MVSVLAVYYNDPSSNPAEAYSFSVKFVLEDNENEQKEAEVGPFKKLNKNGPCSKSSFAVIRVRFVGY